MVVIAENEAAARLMHPDMDSVWNGKEWRSNDFYKLDTSDMWGSPDSLVVEYLGTAKEGSKPRVVEAYFRHG